MLSVADERLSKSHEKISQTLKSWFGSESKPEPLPAITEKEDKEYLQTSFEEKTGTSVSTFNLDSAVNNHLNNNNGQIHVHRDFLLKSKFMLVHVKDNIYLIKYKTFNRRFPQPIKYYFDLLDKCQPIDLFPNMMKIFSQHIQPAQLLHKYLPKIDQNPSYDAFYQISTAFSLDERNPDANTDPLLPIIKIYLMAFMLNTYIELRKTPKYSDMFTKKTYNSHHLSFYYVVNVILLHEKDSAMFKEFKNYLSKYLIKLSNDPDHYNRFCIHLIQIANIFKSKVDASELIDSNKKLGHIEDCSWYLMGYRYGIALKGYRQHLKIGEESLGTYPSLDHLITMYLIYDKVDPGQDKYHQFKKQMDRLTQEERYNDETSKYANNRANAGFALFEINENMCRLIKDFLCLTYDETGKYTEVNPIDSTMETTTTEDPSDRLYSSKICTSRIVKTGVVIDNKVEFVLYAEDKGENEYRRNNAIIKMYVDLSNSSSPSIVFGRTYEYSYRHTYQMSWGNLFCHQNGKNYFMYNFMNNIVANIRGPSFKSEATITNMSLDKIGTLTIKDVGVNPELFKPSQFIHPFYSCRSNLCHNFTCSTTASSYDNQRLIFCGVSTFDPLWKYDKTPQPENFKNFIKYVRDEKKMFVTYQAKFIFICLLNKDTFEITNFSHSFIPRTAKTIDVTPYGVVAKNDGSLLITYSDHDTTNNIMHVDRMTIDKLLLPANQMLTGINKHQFMLI